MTTIPDDELWSAIGDPSRRRLLDLLVERGQATASALSVEVPFTRQAVAKHLDVLQHAGLVVRRREGREVLFRVDPDRLDAASRAMTQQAHDWDRRLAAIKQLAEAAHRDPRER
jgi:DNA-binding transcriptional ArsR family regulator